MAALSVCEKEHRHVESGDLEFNLLRAAWQSRHDDPRVQKMAECFLDSYLKIRTIEKAELKVPEI